MCLRYDASNVPSRDEALTINFAGSEPTPVPADIWCCSAFCAAPTAVGPLGDSDPDTANRRGRARGHPVCPLPFFFLSSSQLTNVPNKTGNGVNVRQRKSKNATRGPRLAARRPFPRPSAQLTNSMRTTIACANAKSVKTSAFLASLPRIVSRC
jgi:hypothetical protein